MVFSDCNIFQHNSIVKVDSFRNEGRVLGQEIIVTEQGVAAGPEAAEGAPAAGYGREGDVGLDVDVLPTPVANDALPWLAGNHAADGAGGVADGQSSAGAECMN